MANFMEFKVDANKNLHLNVDNVYRVGLAANDPTDADVLFYYNVASAADTNVWAVNVKLASAISQKSADRKSTRLNSSHPYRSRLLSSAKKKKDI